MTHAAAPLLPALRARRAPTPPVAQLVAGRPVAEVAVLLPRLFSLCRAAQAAAVQTALGGPVDTGGIARDILRDHLLKLCIAWPRLLGMGGRPLPSAALSGAGDAAGAGDDRTPSGGAFLPPLPAGGPGVAEAIFGPARRVPATPADFDAFLAAGQGAGAVLAALDTIFAPGIAVAGDLPAATAATIRGPAPVENSVAARHLDNPVMAHLAATRGRGPLWRAAARLFDVAAALDGTLPAPSAPSRGEAMVPATRGVYALRIETEGDIVTGLDRVTPTDSLLARDGVLDRALATLPADRAGLAPLLLDILDPCSPVRLEATHA